MVSYSSDNELVPCFGAKRRAGLGNRSARPGSKEHRGNVSRRHWFGSAAWGQRSSPMPAGPVSHRSYPHVIVLVGMPRIQTIAVSGYSAGPTVRAIRSAGLLIPLRLLT
jgi:hypothetical protein